MYYLHKATSAVSCVNSYASQWEATLRDDVGFPTVYRRIYCRKFLTLSNQTSRYIHKCIRMKRSSNSLDLQIEGWSQDCSKSDGCFSQYLISSPWRRYEDYNISFCKQWKFRCHCSYEQWHLNLHCLQRDQSCMLTRVSKICLRFYSLALNPRNIVI